MVEFIRSLIECASSENFAFLVTLLLLLGVGYGLKYVVDKVIIPSRESMMKMAEAIDRNSNMIDRLSLILALFIKTQNGDSCRHEKEIDQIIEMQSAPPGRGE